MAKKVGIKNAPAKPTNITQRRKSHYPLFRNPSMIEIAIVFAVIGVISFILMGATFAVMNTHGAPGIFWAMIGFGCSFVVCAAMTAILLAIKFFISC